MLQGVNAAAVTPRRDNERGVDLGAALDLIDFLTESGIHGIALLGSTGEFPHFDFDDRRHLVQFAVKRTRLPLFVNVSHSFLDGAVALAREAITEGAAALLLMPPHFFRYSQAEIKQFYLEFAKRARDGVPILLYNVPLFTNEIACETAVDLLATGMFAGIKDSSGRIGNFERLQALRQQKSFTLLVGNDRIFTRARAAGADGVISGVACAVPELMLALDRAILAGDSPQKDRLEARLQEFIDWIDPFPVPVGIREAAAARGLKTGPHAVPLDERTARRLEEFRDWFQGWLPEVRKESSGA